MKKVLFFGLSIFFSFVYADDEFEKLLKQCFKIKRNEEIGGTKKVNFKKGSGEEYSIDAKGQTLFLKQHLKIPDYTILKLLNVGLLEGCDTQLIVDKSALLRIDCENLFGKNISLIFYGYTKKAVNEKDRYCLNNLDLKNCCYFRKDEIGNNKFCLKLYNEYEIGIKRFVRIPLIVAGEHSRLYEEEEIK